MNSNKKNKLNYQFGFVVLFGIFLFSLVGFINLNVKNIVTIKPEIAATNNEKSSKIIFTKMAEKSNKKNGQNTIAIKKIKQSFKQDVVAINKNTATKTNFENTKNVIIKGFQELANDIANNKEHFTIKNNVANFIDDSMLNSKNIEPIYTANNLLNIDVQRFIIPASATSAASLIIVTTSIKYDGKKQVKIEIEKINSRIE